MPLDPTLILPLLSEEESATLDFKREQYRFYGASDDEKAELLKDILAFVNAWRRTDAYILIGVDEVTGGPAKVVGISSHLSDADLQQFVNGKTNQPVLFAYRTAEIDGAQLGVIHIPVQDRPRFLVKSFSKLVANAVYLRRGSSTEIARPDEVSRMGMPAAPIVDIPEIRVRFANVATRTFIDGIYSQSVILDMDDLRGLPNFTLGAATEKMNGYAGLRTNSAYWRQLAWYAIAHSLYRPFNLAFTNESSVAALDVRAEFSVSNTTARLLDATGFPHKRPSRVLKTGTSSETPSFSVEPSVRIRCLADQYLVEVRVGKIQPKATIWIQEPLYVGAECSGAIGLNGIVTADNLPVAKEVTLSVECKVQHRPFAFADVQQLESDRFMAEEGRGISLALDQLRKQRGA